MSEGEKGTRGDTWAEKMLVDPQPVESICYEKGDRYLQYRCTGAKGMRPPVKGGGQTLGSGVGGHVSLYPLLTLGCEGPSGGGDA